MSRDRGNEGNWKGRGMLRLGVSVMKMPDGRHQIERILSWVRHEVERTLTHIRPNPTQEADAMVDLMSGPLSKGASPDTASSYGCFVKMRSGGAHFLACPGLGNRPGCAYVRLMKMKCSILVILCLLSLTPSAWADPRSGCEEEFRVLFDQAVVELQGEGDLDVVVVTDPLCWHCRLGHKLLGEYPKKYGRLRLSFYPRKSFIGSDMAAWIHGGRGRNGQSPGLCGFRLLRPETAQNP